jgi:hypothetical protein
MDEHSKHVARMVLRYPEIMFINPIWLGLLIHGQSAKPVDFSRGEPIVDTYGYPMTLWIPYGRWDQTGF